MTLKDLIGISFDKVKTLNTGNIYTGSGLTLFLKPTDREYSGKNKKPSHYLSCLHACKTANLPTFPAYSRPVKVPLSVQTTKMNLA